MELCEILHNKNLLILEDTSLTIGYNDFCLIIVDYVNYDFNSLSAFALSVELSHLLF